MHRVAVAVTDGAPLLELAAPLATFGVSRPARADDWYEVRICATPEAKVGGGIGADPTTGGCFRADTRYGLEDLGWADTVIVPPCHDERLRPPADLVEALRAAHAGGARIASICTGAFALAAAGLLDGRRATTHWRHAAELRAAHPEIAVDPDVLYVDEGDLLTSAGRAAGVDLCLHLISLDHGAAVAAEVARRVVVAPHRDGGQAQFIEAALPVDGDHRLAETMEWALAHLDQPLTVTDLAAHANMGTRNLVRHFSAGAGTTPLRWLLRQRVRRAQELLERTDRGVEEIALETGMGTAATLRRHFNRFLDTTPTAYRDSFATTSSEA